MQTGEYYNGQLLAADQTAVVGSRVAGFLCTAEGTLTLTDFVGHAIVDSLPVVIGFNRIAILFNYPAGNTVTSSSAVGTILI